MAANQPTVSREAKRVYLDVCALNRPLDDQSQMRIRLETDAVLLILGHARERAVQIVVSPVHYREASANPDLARREHVLTLLRDLGTEVSVDLIQTRQRAEHLFQLGLRAADAAHVAFAEAMESDFVSVDDRLLRQLQRVGCKVWFGTPTAYCDKEDLR